MKSLNHKPMKKLFAFVFLSWLSTCQPQPCLAQCAAPQSFSYKSGTGDYSFYPTDGASVYELWHNADTVPVIVSTPASTDRQGRFHFYTKGSLANYYSIPVPAKGSTIRLRAFCMPMWYNFDQRKWNYDVYKYDQSKFSDFVTLIIK